MASPNGIHSSQDLTEKLHFFNLDIVSQYVPVRTKPTTLPKLLILVLSFSGEDTSSYVIRYFIFISWEVCRSIFWGATRYNALKEKLPRAFMLIGWMEHDFRNISAKACANLHIQSRAMLFFERFDFLDAPKMALCMWRIQRGAQHARAPSKIVYRLCVCFYPVFYQNGSKWGSDTTREHLKP